MLEHLLESIDDHAGEQRESNLSISIQTSSPYPQMQEGDG